MSSNVAPANVRVIVRVRPLNDAELNKYGPIGRVNALTLDNDVYNCSDDLEESAKKSSFKNSTIMVGNFSSGNAYESDETSSSAATKRFMFDAVHGPKSTQNEVFDSVEGIVDAVASGYNGTIVAYGQTGSGKTHTVFGCNEDQGLVQRSLQSLFHKISVSNARDNITNNQASEVTKPENQSQTETTFQASFFEIFNERVYDLLSDNSLENALPVREDVNNKVYVNGLSEIKVRNPEEAENLLLQGISNRHVAATNMNRTSSRSHAVFVLSVRTISKSIEGIQKIITSKFTLVDLAGSERQKNTDTSGKRLKEAANINSSLLSLGHVINALVDREAGRDCHVPFRNSKLTFLLRDSWGGNSKTCLVATVSPSAFSLGETMSTLNFAQRAKLIKNTAVLNEDTCGTLVALQAEVARLRSQLKMKESMHQLVTCDDEKASNSINFAHQGATKANDRTGWLEKDYVENKKVVRVLKRKLQEETMIRKFKERRIDLLQRSRGDLAESEQIEILKSEIKALRKLVDEPSADAIKWRVAYEKSKEQLSGDSGIIEELDLMEIEMTKLDKTNEDLKKEKAGLENKVKNLASSSRETQKEIDSILQELDRLEKEMKSLKNELAQKENELKEAQFSIKSANDQSNEAREEIFTLKTSLDTLQKQVDKFSGDIQNKEDILEKMAKDKVVSEKCLLSKIEKLDSMLLLSEREMKNLKDRNGSLSEELKLKTKENSSLNKAKDNSSFAIKEKNAEINLLQLNLQKMESEKELALKQISDLSEKASSWDKQRQEERKQLDAVSSDLELNIALVQDLKAKLEDSVMKNKSASLDLERKIETLLAENGDLSDYNYDLKNQIETFTHELKESKLDVSEKSASLEELKNKMNVFISKEAHISNEYRSKVEALEGELVVTKESKGMVELEVSSLRNCNEKCKEELEISKGEVLQLENRIRELKELNQTYHHDAERARDELVLSHEKLVKSYESDIKRLKFEKKSLSKSTVADIEHLKSLFTETKAKYDKMKNKSTLETLKYESTILDLRRECEQLKNDMVQYKNSEKAVKDNAMMVEDKMTLLKREKSSIEFELSSLKEEKDMLERENIELQIQLDNIKKYQSDKESQNKTPSWFKKKQSSKSWRSTKKNSAAKNVSPREFKTLSCKMDDMLERVSTEITVATEPDCESSFDESLFLPNANDGVVGESDKENGKPQIMDNNLDSSSLKDYGTPFQKNASKLKKNMSSLKKRSVSGTKHQSNIMLFDVKNMFENN